MDQAIKNRIEQIKKRQVPVEYENTFLGVFPIDWEKKTLSSVSVNNGTYGINAAACNYCEYLPKYIRITDIDNNGNYIDNNAYVNDINSKDYILKTNDIVFARTGASVGKNYLYKEKDGELVYAGFLIKYSIDSEKCNPYIVYANCNSKAYWNWVKIVCSRSGQPGINAEEYSSYKFQVANSKEEQKRIAKILMKWDEAVELQESYITKLEIRKKALMQKLLTVKEEWKDVKFSNAITFFKYKIELQRKNYQEKGIYPIIDQGKNSIAGYTNIYEALNICPSKGLLLFGDHTTEFKFIKNNFVVGGDGVKLFKTKEPYNLNFIYYSLLLNPIIIEGYKRHYGILRNKTLFFPIKNGVVDSNEQKYISDILSISDEEISLQQQKLKKLMLQRKSLQQLLLTGIVRVI